MDISRVLKKMARYGSVCTGPHYLGRLWKMHSAEVNGYLIQVSQTPNCKVGSIYVRRLGNPAGSSDGYPAVHCPNVTRALRAALSSVLVVRWMNSERTFCYPLVMGLRHLGASLRPCATVRIASGPTSLWDDPPAVSMAGSWLRKEIPAGVLLDWLQERWEECRDGVSLGGLARLRDFLKSPGVCVQEDPGGPAVVMRIRDRMNLEVRRNTERAGVDDV
jgi:hypothetical protein